MNVKFQSEKKRKELAWGVLAGALLGNRSLQVARIVRFKSVSFVGEPERQLCEQRGETCLTDQ